MPISKTFLYCEDADYGGLGLLPINHPNANTGTGFVVAHDLLEHFSNDSGSVADELLALGALLYIRGVGDYPGLQGKAVRTIAQDVANMLLHNVDPDALLDGSFLPNIPQTKSVSDLEGGDWLEEELIGFTNLWWDSFSEETDGLVEVDDNLKELLGPMILNYIKTGFRKASKRYKEISPYTLSYLFEQIEAAVDNAMKYMEKDLSRLRLSFYPSRGYCLGTVFYCGIKQEDFIVRM